MPELPEVEWARRCLHDWLSDSEVVRTEAENVLTFRPRGPASFLKLCGKVLRLERKGKYLLFSFHSGPSLLSHLGMTGKWVRASSSETVPYSRARLFLKNQEVLHFQDARLFGRLEVTKASSLKDIPDTAKLGRDPLADGLDAWQLQEALGALKKPIKVALMEQTRIAGLGNIHAQEALFRAGIHPQTAADSLSLPAWRKLCAAIHDAIDFALAQVDGEHMAYVQDKGADNPFFVYGKATQPCPRCQTIIQRLTQAGRSTHFCPRCQPQKP